MPKKTVISFEMPKKKLKSGQVAPEQINVHVPSEVDIPDSIFSQLNEFVVGGYVLFYSGPGGRPQIRMRFDSEIHSIGINNFIRYYADSIEDSQAQAVDSVLCGNKNREDDDE